MNIPPYKNRLIPFVSSHFIWEDREENNFLTSNKVYPIKEWVKKSYGYTFSFVADNGAEVEWLLSAQGLKGCSYEYNLEKILE